MKRGADRHVQEREMQHPVRRRIWKLYQRNPGRSLAAVDLLRDMPDVGDATPATLNYHVNRLKRVGLIRA